MRLDQKFTEMFCCFQWIQVVVSYPTKYPTMFSRFCSRRSFHFGARLNFRNPTKRGNTFRIEDELSEFLDHLKTPTAGTQDTTPITTRMTNFCCPFYVSKDFYHIWWPSMWGEDQNICDLQIHSRKKRKKLCIIMFCKISLLKISELYKFVSTMIMHINTFQNVFIQICMHLYSVCHNYTFCNAKEHFYKVLVNVPLLFLVQNPI